MSVRRVRRPHPTRPGQDLAVAGATYQVAHRGQNLRDTTSLRGANDTLAVMAESAQHFYTLPKCVDGNDHR